MQQGTLEWKQARLGMITASRFADVMTQPKTTRDREAGKLSQTAMTYLRQLAWEVWAGKYLVSQIASGVKDYVPRACQWGLDNEDQARDVYQELTGNLVEQTGFLSIPDTRVGCSPDGLVGDDGGVEIKCPYTGEVHCSYRELDTVPKEYFWQVHGAMYVTGADWWDFVSFDPRVDDIDKAIHIVRVERDCGVIDQLHEALQVFEFKLNEYIERG